jgi:hypothetical protein
MLNYENAY